MRFGVWVVVAGLALGGCKAEKQTAPAPARDAGAPPAATASHEILRERQAIIDGRAVDVDRRFARALADVAKLADQPACTATRHGATTTFACGATTHEVSELADYDALHAALAAAASTMTVTAGGVGASSDWMLDGVAVSFARARSAGKRWASERTQVVALDGLHGLIGALLAEQDAFGITDSVAARALALLVVAERGGPRPLEAALLAHLLGYDAASVRIAATLPTTEPARDFLVQPLVAAARTEKDGKASPLALYLAHRVLLEAREPARAAALRARMDATLAARTAVQAARLLAVRDREPLVLALLLPWLGLEDARELAGQASDRGAHFETEAEVRAVAGADRQALIRTLDTEVTSIDRTGAFLEGGLVDDHFGALVASSDDAYRVAEAQQLDIPELEQAMLAREKSERPRAYEAGTDWLRFASALLLDSASQRTLPEYLERPTALVGAGPIDPVIRAFWSRTALAQKVQKEVDVALLRRLDGRPSNRPLLATLAWHLYDLVRFYELGHSWQAVDGGHGTNLSLEMRIGDGHADEVHAQLADARASKRQRRGAYEALEEAKLVGAADRKAMASLILDDHPGPLDVLAAARLLDPRAAEAACDRWLRDHPEDRETRRGATVATQLAELQQARKDLAGAERTITPALAHGDDDTVYRAALVHLARKDIAGAEGLVLSRMSTSPTSKSIANAVEVLLRSKHYTAAAKILAAPPVPLGWIPLIRSIAPGLARAITDEASLKAFVDELKVAGFNFQYMVAFDDAFADAKHEDLAFDVLMLVPGTGFLLVQNAARAYPHLVAARGDAVAQAWAMKTISPPLIYPFGAFIQSLGEIDFLFTVVPDPSALNPVEDIVWLYRLTALVMHHEGSGPRWTRVKEHYATVPVGSEYDVLGRHILGILPLEAVDKVTKEPSEVAEAAYYVALEALANGRIADACDWLQVVLQGGFGDKREFQESRDLAKKLATAWQSPEQLAKVWKLR